MSDKRQLRDNDKQTFVGATMKPASHALVPSGAVTIAAARPQRAD